MGDILINNKILYAIEINFIHYFSYLVKICFVLFMIGVLSNKPHQLLAMNFVIKIILGLFLVYRFNKYRTKQITFSELDRKIIYSSGLYIILLSFADLITAFLTSIRQKIIPYTIPIINKSKKGIEYITHIIYLFFFQKK